VRTLRPIDIWLASRNCPQGGTSQRALGKLNVRTALSERFDCRLLSPFSSSPNRDPAEPARNNTVVRRQIGESNCCSATGALPLRPAQSALAFTVLPHFTHFTHFANFIVGAYRLWVDRPGNKFPLLRLPVPILLPAQFRRVLRHIYIYGAAVSPVA
jgi:hypothetical protein